MVTMPAAEQDDDQAITLADRVYDLLSDAIINGELSPGVKLSEPDLSRRYGVSRGPLREAIRRLEERRLVTRSPWLGARVITLDLELLRETFSVREVLEGLAAREAAQRVSDAQIEELRDMLEQHERMLNVASHNYVQGTADQDFHFAVARFSGNANLYRLLCGEYYQLIGLFRRQHAIVPGRAKRAFTEHKRIFEAIADRDGELAEILMRRHVGASRRSMENMLASAAPEPPPSRSRRRSSAAN